MLKVNSINVSYGNLQVLYNVSISVEEGEIVGIVGSNGAGKSTILKTIIGLLHPISGSITFENERIDNMLPHMIIQHGIAMVPEGRQVFPYMTVKENLELGAYSERNKKNIQENLDWVFNLFPILKERQYQLAGTFSGGEQQMLVIARALMSKPKIIMFDEPSLGLAPSVIKKVFETINFLNKEGSTIILVEQNVMKCLEIAKRSYVIENGRIVMSGNSNELLNTKEIKEAYIGI